MFKIPIFIREIILVPAKQFNIDYTAAQLTKIHNVNAATEPPFFAKHAQLILGMLAHRAWLVCVCHQLDLP
jgi:hypothetical protein